MRQDKKIIFARSDSSHTIGTGHAMRLLRLTKQLRSCGIRVIHLCRALLGNINHVFMEAGFEVKEFPGEESNECLMLESLSSLRPGLVILDLRDADSGLEALITGENIRLAVYDDIYLPHGCDLLINPNIHADQCRYKGKVPNHARILAGPEFAVLSDDYPENKAARDKKILEDVPCRLLVTLGGSDPSNVLATIIAALQSYKGLLEVRVIAGPANKNADMLKDVCNGVENFNFIHKVESLAVHFAWADMAIIAAGQTCLEAVYMNVPTINIQVADDQGYVGRFMRENDLSISLSAGLSEKTLHDSIEQLRRGMAPSMKRIQDFSRRIAADSPVHEILALISHEAPPKVGG